MRRLLFAACLIVGLMLLFCQRCLAADGPGAKTWGGGHAIATPTQGAVTVQATVVVSDQQKRLGLLERRKLGLTVGNIRPVVKRLIDEGQISTDDPASVIAAAVMAEMGQSQAWADEVKAGNIDWDAILAFIEKLIPLIVQLISLFG